MDTICRHLPWDSGFFSFKVGAIDAAGLNAAGLNAAVGQLRTEGYRLVYVFAGSLMQGLMPCFVLADNKRSYILDRPYAIAGNSSVIDYKGEPEPLYDLAYQAGEFSRFRIDRRIGDENFRRLYRLWIDNSVAGVFADHVFVAEDAGKRPIGLITARKKDGMLSIGLFATDRRWRGTGIGSALIGAVITAGAHAKIPVEVTTQADNQLACRFYEHKGFRLRQQEAVYHLWL